MLLHAFLCLSGETGYICLAFTPGKKQNNLRSMQKYSIFRYTFPLLFLFSWLNACISQDGANLTQAGTGEINIMPAGQPGFGMPRLPEIYPPGVDTALQINGYVRRIFQDKAGHLWFATYGNGVGRYDGKSMSYFTGFEADIVRDIAVDKSGKLWFATNAGVYCYDGTDFKHYTEAEGLSSKEVWSVLEDKAGDLWFGTDNGVCHYDGKKFSVLPVPAADLSGFPSAYPAPKLVNSIFQDKNGILWFASNGGGVYRYDGKSFIAFTEKNGLCNNFVVSVFEDHAGNLWFATQFGGVSRYDGKSFTTFREKDGLNSNFVWTVFEDKTGNLWFATAGGGVSRYDGTSFTKFTITDGLPSNYIQSIMEDDAGNLWFGTSEGIARYDGKSFVSFPKKGGAGC
jgi:ligand-binding sensor domain-containing protein